MAWPRAADTVLGVTQSGTPLVLPLLVVLLVGHADRAATQDAPNGGSRKVAVATRADTPVAIDGALDDEAWQMATPLTDFIQADPLEGEPPTEQTEVKLLFDDEASTITGTGRTATS